MIPIGTLDFNKTVLSSAFKPVGLEIGFLSAVQKSHSARQFRHMIWPRKPFTVDCLLCMELSEFLLRLPDDAGFPRQFLTGRNE